VRDLRALRARLVDRVLGIHSLRATVAPAVAGGWLWHAACSCGLMWRGVEPTREAAHTATTALLGRRDRLLIGREYGPRDPAVLWREVPTIRVGVGQLALPAGLRGTGSVVACDGSLRDIDQHAGWGVVTDAGWTRQGRLKYLGADICAIELHAIGQALLLYPDGHQVTVLSDNSAARIVARRVFTGELVRRVDCPKWVSAEGFRLLRAARHRRLRVSISTVKSKTHPLHNVADRLARRLDVGDLAPALLVPGGAT